MLEIIVIKEIVNGYIVTCGHPKKIEFEEFESHDTFCKTKEDILEVAKKYIERLMEAEAEE